MTAADWDAVYSAKAMGAYPDPQLISFVAQHYYKVPDRKQVEFLDVGCGAGSSTWFLAREGFSVIGVDQSAVAIDRAIGRLSDEGLMTRVGFHHGDLLAVEPEFSGFDCAIDVAALCYIDGDRIAGVMAKLYAGLKPGGRIFSMAPTDRCSRPPYENTIPGASLPARFLSKPHVESLFGQFNHVQVLPYSYMTRALHKVDLWVVDAVK